MTTRFAPCVGDDASFPRFSIDEQCDPLLPTDRRVGELRNAVSSIPRYVLSSTSGDCTVDKPDWSPDGYKTRDKITLPLVRRTRRGVFLRRAPRDIRRDAAEGVVVISEKAVMKFFPRARLRTEGTRRATVFR